MNPRRWLTGVCWVLYVTSSDHAALLAAAQSLGEFAPSARVLLRPDCVIVAVRDEDGRAAEVAAARRAIGDQVLMAAGLLFASVGVVWVGIARGYCRELPTPVLQSELLGRGVVRAERAWRTARAHAGVAGGLAFGDDRADDFPTFLGFVLGDDAPAEEDLKELYPPITDEKKTGGIYLTSRVVDVATLQAAAYGRTFPGRLLVEPEPVSRAAASLPDAVAFSMIVDLIDSSSDLPRDRLSEQTIRFHRVVRKHLPALLDVGANEAPSTTAEWTLDNRLYFCSTGDGFQMCRYFDSAPSEDTTRLLLSWLVTFVMELRRRKLRARVAVALGTQDTRPVSIPSRSDPWLTRNPVVRPNCAIQAHEKSSTILDFLHRSTWHHDEVLVVANDGDDRGHGLLDAVAGHPAGIDLRCDGATGRMIPATYGETGFVVRLVPIAELESTLGAALDAAVVMPPETPPRPSFPALCDAGRAERIFEAFGPTAAKTAVRNVRVHNIVRAMIEAALTSGAGVIALAAHDDRSAAVAAGLVLLAVALGGVYAWLWGMWIGRLMWTHVGPTMRRFCFARDARDAIQRLKIRLLLPNDDEGDVSRALFGWPRSWFAPRRTEHLAGFRHSPLPEDRRELRLSRSVLATLVVPGILAYVIFTGFLVVSADFSTARERWWFFAAGVTAGALWNAALVVRLMSLSFEHFSTYQRVSLAGRIKLGAWAEIVLAVVSCVAHGVVFVWVGWSSEQAWVQIGAWVGGLATVAVLTFIVVSRSFSAHLASVTGGDRGALEAAGAEEQRQAAAVVDALIIDRPLLGRLRSSATRARSLRRAVEVAWEQRGADRLVHTLAEADALFVVDQYGDVIWQRGLSSGPLSAKDVFADGKFAAKIVGDLIRYARERWLHLCVSLDAGTFEGETRSGDIRTVTASLDAFGLGRDDELPAGYLAVVHRLGPATDAVARGYAQPRDGRAAQA